MLYTEGLTSYEKYKRMRAKKYCMRKKQREIDCENNPQTQIKPQNKSLREAVTRLRKEKELMQQT